MLQSKFDQDFYYADNDMRGGSWEYMVMGWVGLLIEMVRVGKGVWGLVGWLVVGMRWKGVFRDCFGSCKEKYLGKYGNMTKDGSVAMAGRRCKSYYFRVGFARCKIKYISSTKEEVKGVWVNYVFGFSRVGE